MPSSHDSRPSPFDSSADSGNLSSKPIPWDNDDDALVIGRRFDHVNALTGETPFLCLGNRRWTHREVADSADRICSFLRARKPSGRVLLFLGNSFHHFAASMGAWKAGWVTIPVDPRYPSDRNGQILRDADPDLVITDPEHRERISTFYNGSIESRHIDQFERSPSGETASISAEIVPDTPCVILYTSGSTGKPKGILHTHASICHMVRRRGRAIRACPADNFTLFYSASVMGGITTVLTALLSGGCIFPRDIKNDGIGDLSDWLRRHRITHCHSVTSLFREFANHIGPGHSFPDLRMVALGGEQAYRGDVELGRRVFGSGMEFYCGLGSTEINTLRLFPIGPDTALPPDRIPFGYPYEDVEIILLDEQLKPVSPGEIGEICVRCRYLSIGYWQQPEKTRERYIQDPGGSDIPVYRTGDLGRFEADGCLTGAGRNDHQVKIRGFRVEPGEVNAHLLAQPGVREACTIAVHTESKGISLASFYVPVENRKMAAGDLRRQLASELPSYMVPDCLIALKDFPRTPNGKIDTRALKVPEAATVAAKDLPETPTEERLARIWAMALGREGLSVEEGFFDQGGNSLTAATLSARIEKTFGHHLPITVFFEYPTIRTLAAWIDSEKVDRPWSSLVPIRPLGSGRPLYIIGGMTGEVVFCRHLVRHLKTKRPIFALEPDTHSGGLTRHARIEDVAGHYAREIRRHQPEGPYLITGYSFGGTVAYELARQLDADGHQVEQTIIFDSEAPRPRAKGPTESPADAKPGATRPPPPSSKRKKPSFLRFLRPGWWLRSRGHWRRSYWRLKYVKVYELLVKLNLSPPVSWRRCYAFWATHWMGQRYRARPYKGATTLIRSEARRNQGDRGWRDLCGDSLHLIRVPGDHGSIFSEPDVRHLAREVDRVLALADGK